jgi:plasmid stability protein
MGEMTIKGIDEALLRELRSQADRQGIEPEVYAKELLRQSLALRRGSRAAKAREVLASQPKKAKTESTILIREDRARR